MTSERRGGVVLLLIASAVLIVWGTSLQRSAQGGMGDFKTLYYATGCLFQHCDPYNVRELEHAYLSGGWKPPAETISERQGAILFVNLPGIFIIAAPFAALPWGPAHALWMSFLAGGLILASFLTWDLGARYAPTISALLCALVLANSEVAISGGNAAGIVISLCVVASWCFLQSRLSLLGVLSLAIGLAIKPHDAGLVWLYFLLAGSVYRKRALQALAATVVFSLMGAAWISAVAPHWMQEQYANVHAISTTGSLNNPGPTNVKGPDPDTVISLETVFSVFRDDATFYNAATYLICGMLLSIWSVHTLRASPSPETTWLALATVIPITILATYHRPYDAKLLLLSIPACSMLWTAGGTVGWAALLINTAAIVLTGDIPLALLAVINQNMHVATNGVYGKLLTIALNRPAPVILLVMAIFYLWVYVQSTRGTQLAHEGNTN